MIGRQVFQQNRFRGKPVVRVHVMIKPYGPICNLDCAYCYYLSKEGLLHSESNWKITDEVLESFIRQYIQGQNYKQVVFSWQGGEPTLLGLDFFRKVIELEKKYAPSWMRCENDFQTNGTLLDDEWCKFLKKNNFMVGLSIDGPKRLHDTYRLDKSGLGTFDRVFRASGLLRKHEVKFGTLSCVNYLTGKEPLTVYRFLRDEVKSRHMQFIPIVEPKKFRSVAPQYWNPEDMPELGSSAARPGTEDSVVEDWCVDPDDWGEFLCKMFDEWLVKGIGKVYLHYFEAAVETWMGRVNPLCTLAPMCGKCLALEHDGSVFSCDHYVYPEYCLGKVQETDLIKMVLAPNQERFGKSKEGKLPAYCRRCEFRFACFGECPKNRFVRTPVGESGLNYLCSGWKKFFSHIDPHMRKIVRDLGYEPVKGVTGESFDCG